TPTDTTPTTTTPTGGGVTSVPTEATLRPGTTGSSITDLQKALNQLGYDVGTADGNYGAATTAAVTAFQKDKGLTQDGVAGPTTLAAINTALAAGCSAWLVLDGDERPDRRVGPHLRRRLGWELHAAEALRRAEAGS